jgi:hypothetical protein
MYACAFVAIFEPISTALSSRAKRLFLGNNRVSSETRLRVKSVNVGNLTLWKPDTVLYRAQRSRVVLAELGAIRAGCRKMLPRQSPKPAHTEKRKVAARSFRAIHALGS